MVHLNFPAYDVKLKKEEGKVWIFDVIRKKFVVITPEEWVRQHSINYYINELKYPRPLIKVETGLKFNTLSKRADIVVYDRLGHPWLVTECKSYHEKLNDSTIHQLATYNQSLGARYLAITNGMQHFCFHVDHVLRKTRWLKDFPTFTE